MSDVPDATMAPRITAWRPVRSYSHCDDRVEHKAAFIANAASEKSQVLSTVQ